MQVMFFYESDPISLCDQINAWLEKFDEDRLIKIHNIKQIALPPDAVTVNASTMNCDDAIERESYLVVSIWYDEIIKKRSLKK